MGVSDGGRAELGLTAEAFSGLISERKGDRRRKARMVVR